eukprot:1145643-Pelagomonas_calceolata.AAC.5
MTFNVPSQSPGLSSCMSKTMLSEPMCHQVPFRGREVARLGSKTCHLNRLPNIFLVPNCLLHPQPPKLGFPIPRSMRPNH